MSSVSPPAQACPVHLPDSKNRSRLRRVLLTAAGCVSLALGIIGVFLPVMPTTCFLLLAAGCFSKSSPRFYAWLMGNPWFGEYLRNYRENRMVPRKLQFGSIVFLWLGICVSAYLIGSLWVRLVLLAIGAAVTAHLAALKTTARKDCGASIEASAGNRAAAGEPAASTN